QVTAVSSTGTESPPSNQESVTVNLRQPGEPLTSNGNFSQGTNNWTFTSPNPSTATWSTANNQASIQIQTPFTQLADIQLAQSPIPLTQNRTYVLELDALASQPRTIAIQLSPTTNPSSPYQSFFPFLTPLPQHLTFTFTMNQISNPTAQLAFLLGGSDRDVTLDNVDLWMVAPGDLNRDRKVDLLDLSILTSQWLQQGPSLSADLNHDGKVNFLDHAILTENWSPSSPTNP
ncbi:MAG: carbohydrate binding domain-containing protein, partial [Limisphaerales bacterium]